MYSILYMLFINNVLIDVSNDEIILNIGDKSIKYTAISNIGIELNQDIDYGNLDNFNKFEIIKNILEDKTIDTIDYVDNLSNDNNFRFFNFINNGECILKIIYNLEIKHQGWIYSNNKLEEIKIE